MSVEVGHEADERRYVVRVDGERAGLTQYRERPGLRAFVHTEIGDAYEGQGLGSELIAGALDDTRAAGLAVLPYCPFVKAYIQRHPEYLDLVPEDRREEFEL